MATEPDKRPRKGAPVWALALPVALLCLGVWAARPLPPTVRVYTANGYRVREETTRKYRMLPAREWGLGFRRATFAVHGTPESSGRASWAFAPSWTHMK